MGWDRLHDGPLLKLAQEAIDILITIDRNLEYQQNLTKVALGVVVVDVPRNQLRYYQALRAELLAAVEQVQPGDVVHVPVEPDDLARGPRR